MGRHIAVVCTRNRPELAARTVLLLRRELSFDRILVVDSSDDRSRRALQAAIAEHAGVELIGSDPGLAHQRNVGAQRALEDPEVEYVWWFDDDGLPSEGYRQAIEQVFEDDERGNVGGAGAIVLDRRNGPVGAIARWRDRVKSLFLLHGPQGRVLRSGRNIQVRDTDRRRDVDWIQGCAATYRRAVLEEFRWDERLRGYSWGEDFDFSFRVSRRWDLVVTPDAILVNEESEADRWSARRLACTRTVLLHAWVRERPEMSVPAFWWSIVGESLYVALLSVIGQRPHGWRELRGLLDGARICLAGRSRRDFDREGDGERASGSAGTDLE